MPYMTVARRTARPSSCTTRTTGPGGRWVLLHGWPLSGRSWEKQDGYDHDTLAADLNTLLERLDSTGVTLVGFSMGGGEVARYVGTYDSGRVAKAVFAAAVPPFLLKTDDNPARGLDEAAVTAFHEGIRSGRVAFVDQFVTDFFAVGDRTDLVSEQQRSYNAAIAASASPQGTLDCTTAFSTTDFRDDLKAFTFRALVIHGNSDAIVPFEISGKRTAEAIEKSKLVLVKDAPHGLNVTHAGLPPAVAGK